MAGPDRLQALLAQDVVTGIDFVFVHEDQVALDVHFLRSPATLTTALPSPFPADRIHIHSLPGDEALPDVVVASATWDPGGEVLQIRCEEPGTFARYALRLDDLRVDDYYNDVVFSFKANCPSDTDCRPAPHRCAPESLIDFAVDYRARDFWSFRRALLDFAAQRYPDWEDRWVSDVGVMLAEAMSAVGDELSYYQDRLAREGYLETATQRRSVRRLARLVDYPMHNGLGASTWLDVNVDAASPGPQLLPAGSLVWAEAQAGEEMIRIVFEIGRGLAESLAGRTYSVDEARNSLAPHYWDEDDTCLPVGSTELFVDGHHAADLPLDEPGVGGRLGRWALLQTTPTDPSRPARQHLVRLIVAEDTTDTVLDVPITRLVWEEEQALPFELDLDAALELRGNIVPATAGETRLARFRIGPPASANDPPAAVERRGANGSVAYLYSLPETAERGLVWRGPSPDTARPELHLERTQLTNAGWVSLPPAWEWRRSFIGTQSSQPYDEHFVLDDGEWERVVGFRRAGAEIVHRDYRRGAGATIRFGDGEYGLVPAVNTMFAARYRVGNGAVGNVPARSITSFDPALAFVQSVSNPLPVTNGVNTESLDEVRQLAPEAFRAVTYRAVRPEDYAEAAERLVWVQRAGAAFRWTGSWLTAFVTPDPRGASTLAADRRADLMDQLDRFRQTGRETLVLDPQYADIDLAITVCVEEGSYRADVKERVLEALFGDRRRGAPERPGFFSPDHFTFGTSLDRSALEAVIQTVPGVRAVERMTIRRRGWFDWRDFNELSFPVADNEVLRLRDDPIHPGQGSLSLTMEGGA